MKKLNCLPILFLFSISVYSQQVLRFKKKQKILSQYWIGSMIAFQAKDQQWRKGEISAIRNDSFYIRPKIVHYHVMGNDTLYFPAEGYATGDVYAIPKEGVLIDYDYQDHLRLNTGGGHVHWYWIKSGWIFRVVSVGYVGLTLANGLIQQNFSWSDHAVDFAIAAAVFATGVILKKTYSWTYKLGKKYHLEVKDLSREIKHS